MSDVRVTHIGGPTVLLEIGGWRLLTDPTFDAAGGDYKFGWGTSVVTDDLKYKIDALHESRVDYYFGGTLFEKHWVGRVVYAFNK